MAPLAALPGAPSSASLAGSALEHLPSALLVVSRAHQLKLLNPAAEALFGVSGQRVLGKPLEALFEDAPAVLKQLRRASAGRSATLRQQQLRRSDGRTLVVDLSCAPMDCGDLLIEAQPLDRLRRINQDDRLINIQETTASLVRGLAHEVKNPLGGIRGAAQLLALEFGQQSADNEELAEYTELIIRECDRLTALVDSLLGPSKPLRLNRINVHRVVEHVAKVVQGDMANGKVRLVREYDPSLPGIDADEDLLIQALLNILGNARAALAKSAAGEIRLRTRAYRQFTIRGRRHRVAVGIEIEDNGPGIPEELIDRMFYPMISGRPNGTGLGLAITQTIVRRHRGVIECKSRPGRTLFSVILPLRHAGEGAA